ncbi:FAD-dependent oxidoreductase [Lichenifustis flavocetrariae]|uniref:FAD-dependent monooxygenase n=1 Tax=Lichenifustis flavocetrariae TaxID=2949735 RepID=A0AA41Z521_9HYPH|nr:NAD(P)/FAD-dependent oxidoreductase [Lichenifustis flavocetrariae]MCW6510613.1 FAD-dependent monooxygenase [Lichenifustis flavocetrariae]
MSTSDRKPRIVIAGAGIAGSLIASGLRDRTDCELICLERVAPQEQEEAGTGLNIGPNAIKAMRWYLPNEAETIVCNSLPWSVWTIALTNGQALMDLRLDAVADNPGIRIRWAELYALLRQPLSDTLVYNAELTGCGQDDNGTFVTWVNRATSDLRRLNGIDLLIAGDGRYSAVRQFVLGGPETPSFLNVCLYRVLFPAGPDCPIDDYGQWFNGPNRLLAYKVPGDFVYCAGSFPIPAGGQIPEAMKQPAALRQAYLPTEGEPSREAAFLIDSITRYASRIHWARLQEGTVTYGHKAGILLAGDAAHPMVPTLGQGATQACEDACVTVDEIRLALDAGEPLGVVPARVEARQAERARFVVDLSRRATDTMLAGADPVSGTRWKTEPAFQQELTKLYRDVSPPRGGVAAPQHWSSL